MMQALPKQFSGLSLLMDLNWDHAFSAGTTALALGSSAWLSTILF